MVSSLFFKVVQNGERCVQKTLPIQSDASNEAVADGYQNGNCADWGYPQQNTARSVWYKRSN